MRRSFNGEYPVTNPFGVYDPEAYGNYPGKRHPGTDYGLPENTQLIAGMAGKVTVFDRPASVHTGRGKEVVIAFGNQVRKTCHMNRIDVKTGDMVATGYPIGLSGNTGYSSGPHLHDEYLEDGQYKDLEKHLGEGDDMLTETLITKLWAGYIDEYPAPDSVLKHWNGKPILEFIEYLEGLEASADIKKQARDYERVVDTAEDRLESINILVNQLKDATDDDKTIQKLKEIQQKTKEINEVIER